MIEKLLIVLICVVILLDYAKITDSCENCDKIRTKWRKMFTESLYEFEYCTLWQRTVLFFENKKQEVPLQI